MKYLIVGVVLLAQAQEAPRVPAKDLKAVQRVFIDPSMTSDAELAKMVREKLTYSLMTFAKVTVVASKEQADAILTGAVSSEKMTSFGGVATSLGSSAGGGDYYATSLAVRLINSAETILWVFNSDAIKCKDAPSVCAGKELEKAIKTAQKRK